MRMLAWLGIALYGSILANAVDPFIYLNSDVPHPITEVRTVPDMKSLLQAPPEHKKNLIRVVIYYSHVCPHCIKSAPVFMSVAEAFSCSTNLRFYAFECVSNLKNSTRSDSTHSPMQLCAAEGVEGFAHLNAYVPLHVYDDLGPVPRLSPEHPVHDTSYYAVIKAPSTRRQNLIEWISTTFPLEEQPLCKSGVSQGVPSLKSYVERSGSIELFLNAVHADASIQPQDRFPGTLPNQHQILHDSILFMMFLLRNWVPDYYSEAALVSLYQMVQVTRGLLPGQYLSCDLSALGAYLREVLEEGRPWSFSSFNEILDATHLNGIPMLKVGESPQFLVSKQVSSAFWLYMHLLTVGLNQRQTEMAAKPRLRNGSRGLGLPGTSAQAFQIVENAPVCDPDEVEGRIDSFQSAKKFPFSVDFSPTSMALFFKGLVGNFFSCVECRRHFLFGLDNCALTGCQWLADHYNDVKSTPRNPYEGLILWLFRFHNMVLFRTGTELTAQQLIRAYESLSKISSGQTQPRQTYTSYYLKDVRFPPRALCPDCYESSVTKQIVVSSTLLKRAMSLELSTEQASGMALYRNDIEDICLFDQPYDLQYENTLHFILNLYWLSEWNDRSVQLQWAP